MTILGEGFVALRPDTTGFGEEAQGELSKSLSGGAVLGGVLAAGVGVVALLGKIGASWEDAFHTIQQQTGATGTQLTGLEGDLKAAFAGDVLGNSLKNITAAETELYDRTGLTGKALVDFTKQEADFATLTKQDVGSAVSGTTALFTKFGIAASAQPAALDQLYAATQRAGVGAGQLTSDLTKSGPALEALGFNFTQTTALVAGFESAGIRVTSVSTGLAKVFKDAAKAGEDPLAFFHQITQQILNAKNQTDAFSIASQYFSGRTASDLIAAVKSGKLNITQFAAALQGSVGNIENTATQTASLGQRFTHLKNEVLTALEPAGLAVVDFGSKIADLVVAKLPAVEAQVKSLAPAWSAFTEGITGKPLEPDPGKKVTRLQADMYTLGRIGGTAWDFLKSKGEDFYNVTFGQGNFDRGLKKLDAGFAVLETRINAPGFDNGLKIIDRAWNTFYGDVQKGNGVILNFFENMPVEFERGATKLEGDAVHLGAQIIEGLLKGITSVDVKLGDGIIHSGEKALGKFASWAGISSPSKLFAEQGAFLIAGLAQGITSGEPAVVAAISGVSNRIGQTSISAPRGGLGGGTGGGLGTSDPMVLEQLKQIVMLLSAANQQRLQPLQLKPTGSRAPQGASQTSGRTGTAMALSR